MNQEKLLTQLKYFYGTEKYHRHFLGILYTDGVQYLACETKCYWLIDLVASWQADNRVKKANFQIYEIAVEKDKSGLVTIKDWDNKVLAKQWLDYTDFPLTKFTLWFENNVLFLPSEY